MKAKDLFTIILKVFGIYLIKDVLFSIPQLLLALHQMFDVSADLAIFSLIVSILTFGLYLGIVYLLLFRTDWLISKLRLSSDMSDEPLVANIHRSSVYTIAIIVTGLIILVFAIPQVIRHLYTWYEYMQWKKTIFNNDDYNYGPLLVSLSEVLVGFLFLGNQRMIVNFIESRRRGSKS